MLKPATRDDNQLFVPIVSVCAKNAFFLFCVVALSLTACKKSSPPPERSKQPASASSNISRIHWLCKKRLATETNATGFMKIWALPESARLEAQTLDKLALALANVLPITNQPLPITNYTPFVTAASALWRPLLDDLVQEESYWEFSHGTNAPGQLVLAVKLGETRGQFWQTKLATAIQQLPSKPPVSLSPLPSQARGWQAVIPSPFFFLGSPSTLTLSQSAGW